MNSRSSFIALHHKFIKKYEYLLFSKTISFFRGNGSHFRIYGFSAVKNNSYGSMDGNIIQTTNPTDRQYFYVDWAGLLVSSSGTSFSSVLISRGDSGDIPSGAMRCLNRKIWNFMFLTVQKWNSLAPELCNVPLRSHWNPFR